MLLYSSTAPTGWNVLPTPVKQKFYDIGQKGDWTAHEAYDHLVPDHLKDNPEEVQAWMDGDPSLGINDKDVSRIESGENGGEYSVDNTIMEDSSINRSRGSDNMTTDEYTTAEASNAADAQIIEDSFTGDIVPVESTEVTALVPYEAEPSVVEILGDVVTDVVLPVVYGYKGAKLLHDHVLSNNNQLSTDEKNGLTIGAGTVLTTFLMTTAGAPVLAGAVMYSTGRFIYRMTRKVMAHA